MIVYKYMSYKRFLKSITPEGVCLKVSRPREFNDPFDCCGSCCGEASKELVNEIRLRRIPGVSLFADEFIAGPMMVMLSSRRIFDRAYRVFSASDAAVVGTPAEMLMWAHYGDSSKGVRVAVDIDMEDVKCKRVMYRSIMPILDLSEVKSLNPFVDGKLRRFLIRCLLTKNDVWRYEKERRIIFRVNSLAIKKCSAWGARSKVENAKFVWMPPKVSIRQVCIGSELSRSKQKVEVVKNYLNQLNHDCGYQIEGRMSIRGAQYGNKEYDLR